MPLSQGLKDAIREQSKRLRGTSLAEEMLGIRGSIVTVTLGGRLRRMVRATYKGKPRLLEPYSLRWRNRRRPDLPLIYMVDRVSAPGQIKAFSPDRFEGPLQVTPSPYRPKWLVEL